MRDRRESQSPGTFQIGAIMVVIAIIAVKTLDAILNVLVNSYERFQNSRQARRA